MKTLLLVLLVTTAAFAKSGGATGMRMGGVGYLMPDGNDFTNASQMPMTVGYGIQGLYQTVPATRVSAIMPSAVWGNGNFGLGAWGVRSGTSFSESTQYADSAGGAFGFSMAQGRMSLGVGYGRVISVNQVNDGTLRADFAINPKGKGFMFAAGGSTTINAVVAVRTAVVGVGYQFNPTTALEASYHMNDLDNQENRTISGAFSWGSRIVYLGAGVNYLNVGKLTQGEGRLGLRLGNRFDISGYTVYTFQSGSNPVYGGTARVTF